VLGEDHSHIFPVEISASKNVGALKDVIKEKKKHTFEHVDADALVLWSVSVPADETLEEELSKLELVDEGSLSPVKDLAEIFFSGVVKQHIQIIVKVPPTGEYQRLTVIIILMSYPCIPSYSLPFGSYYMLKYNPNRLGPCDIHVNHPISFMPYQQVESIRLPFFRTNSVNFVVPISTNYQPRLRQAWANRRTFKNGKKSPA
jgi:Crinkler effector protein N-terminal domain